MSYWRRFTAGRMTRRRALSLTGGTAAAAAFLAACGGDDDSASSGSTGGSTGSTGASTGSTGFERHWCYRQHRLRGSQRRCHGCLQRPDFTPVDTSAQGKPGGTWSYWASSDITHFDALISNSFQTVDRCSIWAYNRLLKFKSGFYPKVADGTQEGDMAESWELSPDKLTLTMKIRQGDGVKWDDQAPTSGRMMDMDDVLYSYNKFIELNPGGANCRQQPQPGCPGDLG